MLVVFVLVLCFHDTAPTEIYTYCHTLSLHDALPIWSPEVDLTEGGDSFSTNLGIDTVLSGSLMALNRLYAASVPLDDSYVSPLFGDFAQGFPRSFIQSGTRDLFLSNAVRSEEHTSELQSLMRISYAVFCLKKQTMQ